jgi:hypothetical protein
MRIMTAYTGFHGIVRDCDNLRESCRPGGQIFMTQRTITSSTWHSKLTNFGILRVRCGGTMTYFAGYVLMVSGKLNFPDLIVTVSTDLLAGILELLGNDFFNCRRTVMPVFAEIARNQKISGYDEQTYHYNN